MSKTMVTINFHRADSWQSWIVLALGCKKFVTYNAAHASMSIKYEDWFYTHLTDGGIAVTSTERYAGCSDPISMYTFWLDDDDGLWNRLQHAVETIPPIKVSWCGFLLMRLGLTKTITCCDFVWWLLTGEAVLGMGTVQLEEKLCRTCLSLPSMLINGKPMKSIEKKSALT